MDFELMKANDQLRRWFDDDDALERAMNGDSVPHPNFLGISVVISSTEVSKLHARISYIDGAFFVTDLRSKHGTWITNNEGRRCRLSPNVPTRFHPSYVVEFGSDDKQCEYNTSIWVNSQAAFRVKVMKLGIINCCHHGIPSRECLN
nr:zeaxanthin epoxidase, chloroplastic [Ipomoea batatas]